MPRPLCARMFGGLVVACIALWRLPTPAQAFDQFWSNSRGDGSGAFNDEGNWIPDRFISDVPNASDVAHFGMTTSGSVVPSTYTVSFTTDPTNLRLVVEDDRVTFDLNGHLYQATSPIAVMVGTESGRTGALTVTDGFLSTPLQADIQVGLGGSGVLNVTTGGLVLGSPEVMVGVNGSGTLNINNNGDIIASNTKLGLNSSVTGTAAITGGGSSLLTDEIVVGSTGIGVLNISAGGRVDSTEGIVGDAAGSSGTVTVSGANSRWQMSEWLQVGLSGTGTLRIENGGTVRDQVGLVKNSAIVTGGSTWINDTLNIGRSSTTVGELIIESGSHVQSGDSSLAIGSGNAIAIVRDGGTTWTNTSMVIVGSSGEADLTIESGAAMTSVGGVVGLSSGSKGTARIVGSTYTWTTSGDFVVGGGGEGQLDVNSGQLLFSNESDLILSGSSGVMTIRSGGQALDAFETIVGDGAGKVGELTVTGPGSQLRTLDRLTVGNGGQGALVVTSGGHASNVIGIINANGSVRVQGVNSTWSNGSILNLFGDAALLIEDGGTVSSVGSNISDSASVTVRDATWSNSAALNINSGSAGHLLIEAGGRVTNVSASIGTFSNTSGTVLVHGAAARWINSGELSVGDRVLGTLDISAGGAVESTDGFIGDDASGIGLVTVAGADAKWIATGTLSIGRIGQAAVNIGPGGLIQAAAINLGVAPGSFGNVLVDGNNARLTTTGSLSVSSSSTGVLNVTAGGRVSSSTSFIAQLPESVGTVRVTGAGSLWAISDRLLVGGSGINGGAATLRIQSSGAVSVFNDIVIHGGDQVILEGGTLSTAAITFDGGGTFAWTSGTLHLGSYRGELTTPNDGTLAPGNSVGQTSIDGNYFQQSRGVLEIEIGGPASSDLVDITGTATLSGDLQLKLLGGFVPGPANTFVVFDSRGIAGSFINAANGQRLTTSDGFGSFLVSYGSGSPFNPNQIVLSSFIPNNGDFDHDGDVDGRDFLIWQRGGSPSPNSADDLAAWQGNFGFPGLAASATAVPEPPPRWLGLPIMLLASVRQRRYLLSGRRSLEKSTLEFWPVLSVPTWAEVASAFPGLVNNLRRR